MTDFELPEEITNLIEKAVGENIKNFLITNHGRNEKGKGYLSEFLILSLENKTTKKNIHIVVKQANSGSDLLKSVFIQEIYFYDKIWPKYIELKKTIPNLKSLDIVPKCLATDLSTQRLILENLSYSNFQLWNKKKEFDIKVAELIFASYGKFHGLSFVYKSKNPEEFQELLKNVQDLCEKQKPQLQFIAKAVSGVLQGVVAKYNGYKKREVTEKLEKYAKNCEDLFNETENSEDTKILVHGDGWSNNFMFKFDELGTPTDLRILDFQMIRIGSPVHDLSTALYSGSGKDVVDQIDHLLKVYHDSLSDILKEFECDPKLYSFEDFKKEWKKYSKYGFMKGIFTWIGKLIVDDEQICDINDIVNNKETKKVQIDEEEFDRISQDLIWHMYENEFL